MFQKKIKKQSSKPQRKKGFIGAIGDDLPSLVPIFFSLLIFFGTLSFVFVTLGDRNAYLEKYFESISVSKEILGSSFYSGYTDFDMRVKGVNTTEKYAVGLIYNPELLGNNIFDKDYFIQSFDNLGIEEFQIPIDDVDFFCTVDDSICNSNSDKNYFVFSNDPDFENSIELDIIFKNNQPLTYLYPVTLSTSKGVFGVYLYLIVW
ncbi:MAG: hypothetical protein PHH82_03500 [Candidatus ainarchaeum sp.]|nr:hypothetical protein [Candidatus ainarchaeum sp.]